MVSGSAYCEYSQACQGTTLTRFLIFVSVRAFVSIFSPQRLASFFFFFFNAYCPNMADYDGV